MRAIQTTITALTLIVAVSAACAETVPNVQPKNTKAQLVELARKNMISAMDAANKQGHYCLDLETATIVKPKAIEKLNLTAGEIRIALNYLRTKVEDACMSAAINEATVQILMFKTIEFEAYGHNDPAPFTNSKDQFTAPEFCCGSAELRLNAQLNYLSLSADKRAALEAIPELKKPFNAFELTEHFNPTPRSKP